MDIVAVASRKAETARAFAADTGVARAIESYEAMLADDGIDAVYIPLPNSLHAEWAIKAARAGKHVLCEKPLALNRAEAQAMFEAAAQARVVLLEAYPFWFQPQTAAMLDVIRRGEIGELRSVQASFGFTLRNPDNIRMNPDLGGGALLDAGCYALSLIRLVMGAAPQRVTALASMTGTGVDLWTMATLDYGDGRRAQISCGMDGGVHRHATIVGSVGVIETDYLNHTTQQRQGDARGFVPGRLRVRRLAANNAPFEDIKSPSGSGFAFEAQTFARLIRDADMNAVAAAARASIDIAATLDAIQLSARRGVAVDC